jgi:hypothetical protein
MFDRRHRRLRATWIAATSAWLWAAPAARAQSAEAEALFNDGDHLEAQGKLAEACEAFEGSNRIEPRAGTLIRLGDCRERNHQLASAWSAYKDALIYVKDPRKKAIATAKVAELEPKLSHLTVTVSAASKLDGLAVTQDGRPLDPALWNRAVPVDGGTYAIAAHAPDHQEWTTTVSVPEAAGNVAVDVPRLDVPRLDVPRPPSPRAAPPGAAVVPVATSPSLDEPARTWTGAREASVALAGVAVAGGVAGGVLGALARSKQDSADRLCPDPQMPCANAAAAQAANDAARSRALGANIAFGVGAAALVVGGALWFVGAPHGRDVAVVPDARANGGGLVLVGRF